MKTPTTVKGTAMPVRRLAPFAALALAAALALGACSSPGPEPTVEDTDVPVVETPTPTPVRPDLTTAETSAGTIVVDANGFSVYFYDADTAGSGVSTCSGNCLVAWPSVHPISEADPVAEGITGEVGVITGTDGLPQLTLNGLPLYLFVRDTKPGDVTGQAAGDVWWLVAPDGSKITG